LRAKNPKPLLSLGIPQAVSSVLASSPTRRSSSRARKALLPLLWRHTLPPNYELMGRTNRLITGQMPMTPIRRATALPPQVNFLAAQSLFANEDRADPFWSGRQRVWIRYHNVGLLQNDGYHDEVTTILRSFTQNFSIKERL